MPPGGQLQDDGRVDERDEPQGGDSQSAASPKRFDRGIRSVEPTSSNKGGHESADREDDPAHLVHRA